MGLVAARVEFESVTGLPEDRFVNSLNFRWDGPTAPSEAELLELGELIEDVYNLDTTAGGTLAGRMSREVSRAADAAEVKLYTADALGDLLGSPSAIHTFTLGAAGAGTQSLPGEVALVASIYADMTDVPQEVGDTRPAARRRGRFYWGPLNTGVLLRAADESGVQRPFGTAVAELVEAIDRLGEASKNVMSLNAGLFLSVYSPTDQALRNAIHVHVDDAFDTVRRRGAAPTTRVSAVIDQS